MRRIVLSFLVVMALIASMELSAAEYEISIVPPEMEGVLIPWTSVPGAGWASYLVRDGLTDDFVEFKSLLETTTFPYDSIVISSIHTNRSFDKYIYIFEKNFNNIEVFKILRLDDPVKSTEQINPNYEFLKHFEYTLFVPNIAAEFQGNALACERRYNNSRLGFVGQLDRISKNGNVYNLEFVTVPQASIRAGYRLHEAQLSEAAKLGPGDFVFVTGSISGLDGPDLVLDSYESSFLIKLDEKGRETFGVGVDSSGRPRKWTGK